MTALPVTDRLIAALDHFPHDFIRDEVFLARARRAYAEQLCRDLPVEDDLRVVGHGIYAERLPWDSDFWGYNVARLYGFYPLPSGPNVWYGLNALRQEFARKNVQYAWAVVPAEQTKAIYMFGLAKWAFIETRVTYHRTLHDYDYPQRFAVRHAVAADIPSLMEVSSGVPNPFDRFHADPRLDPFAVDRLFDLWAMKSVEGEMADVVLVPDLPGEPQAWVSFKYEREHWAGWGYRMARPGMGSVDPSLHGWYTRLISEGCYRLKALGIQHIYIPASVANRAVIAAWHKLGFKYGHVEHVFRVAF